MNASGRLGAEADARDEWRRAQVSFRHTHAISPSSGPCADHEFAIGWRFFRIRQASGRDPTYFHPLSTPPEERGCIEMLLRAHLAGVETLSDASHEMLQGILRRYSSVRRVFVETSAINWLADHQTGAQHFFDLRADGAFFSIATPDVANEIRQTRDSERRNLLEQSLARFFPLKPTWLPRAGRARAGLAILSSDAVWKRNTDLAFLKDGLDRVHLVNAAQWSCEVFVTEDQELWSKKWEAIAGILGPMKIQRVEAFLSTFRDCSNG